MFRKKYTCGSFVTHSFLDWLLGFSCTYLSQNNVYMDVFMCCQLIVCMLNFLITRLQHVWRGTALLIKGHRHSGMMLWSWRKFFSYSNEISQVKPVFYLIIECSAFLLLSFKWCSSFYSSYHKSFQEVDEFESFYKGEYAGPRIFFYLY